MIVVTKKDELYGVTGVTVGRLRSNPNAGTHGRRDHDSFDVSSLHGHRLHRIDPIDEGLNVFGELLGLDGFAAAGDDELEVDAKAFDVETRGGSNQFL